MKHLIAYTDTLVKPPTGQALEIELVRKHLRFSPITENTLIDGWITGATQLFEQETDRQVMDATWERWLDAFPTVGQRAIELPKPPLLEVLSVKYVGDDGELVTLDADGYEVKKPAGPYGAPGWIVPAYGTTWPIARCESGAVRVRFRAGYATTPDGVPDVILTALYMLVSHFHRFRSEVHESANGALVTLPLGAQSMMRAFKYSALPGKPPLRGC